MSLFLEGIFYSSNSTNLPTDVMIEQAGERGLRAYAEASGETYTLPDFIKSAKVELERLFGVSNLSVIEAAHLRRIVLESLDAFDDCLNHRPEKHVQWINVDKEAAIRWVCECCDVSLDQIDRELKTTGKAEQSFRAFLQLHRERAHHDCYAGARFP